MRAFAWIEGRVVPASEGRIPALDRGFLYSDGCFETIRVEGQRALRIEEHVERFERSRRILDIPPPLHDPRRVVEDLLSSSAREGRFSIRLILTRGPLEEGEGSPLVRERGEGYLVGLLLPNPHPPSALEEGVKAVLLDRPRKPPPEVLDPRAKTLAYLPNVLARRKARKQGAYEAILETISGKVAEGTTSNVFLVSSGVLVTPDLDSGILDGLTRSEVLQVARSLGIEVEERAVLPEELRNAEEIFLTSTLAGILPVTSLGEKRVGDGRVGRTTIRLQRALSIHSKLHPSMSDRERIK